PSRGCRAPTRQTSRRALQPGRGRPGAGDRHHRRDRAFDTRLRLVGRAGSAMQEAAQALGHPFTAEAFADRRYRSDGSLLPRSGPQAVLVDPDAVADQVRSLVTDGEVLASDGSRVAVAFETLCLPG